MIATDLPTARCVGSVGYGLWLRAVLVVNRGAGFYFRSLQRRGIYSVPRRNRCASWSILEDVGWDLGSCAPHLGPRIICALP